MPLTPGTAIARCRPSAFRGSERLGPTTGPARHRRIRTAAAIAAVAALIATGGYVATTTIGPDDTPSTPVTSTDVNASAQVRRELHQSVAGQYGPAR